jgi:hypothetical protein
MVLKNRQLRPPRAPRDPLQACSRRTILFAKGFGEKIDRTRLRWPEGSWNVTWPEGQEAGFQHTLLLGMGGSSLCQRCLRDLGLSWLSRLLVLDSTVRRRFDGSLRNRICANPVHRPSDQGDLQLNRACAILGGRAARLNQL